MSGPKPPVPLLTTLLLALVLALVLWACGQKGPLYLPDEQAAAPPAPAGVEAPAEAGANDDTDENADGDTNENAGEEHDTPR